MAVLADRRVGTELAGYRVEDLLGRGGMSVVYRALDPRLKRHVALKLLAPELAADERFRERFLRESELAASLDHPSIVPVYEAGEADGVLYIAMRYVDGTDLRSLLRREGPLSPERVLALVSQVAEALDAAHARGLVHRDVKPSNVLISRQGGHEHCYLADFGLTKSASDPGGSPEAGGLVGTIDYVAPEQIQGDRVDGRADVYALACLLYECLTGDVPFPRTTEVAAIYAHLADPPPAPSRVRPGLPVALDVAVARGLAKLPGDRPESAGAFVAEVAAALAVRPGRSRRRAVALSGSAAGLVAGLLALVFLRGGGAPAVQADSLLRISTGGARVTGGLGLDGVPTAVTTCAGSVWVTSAAGTVSEIDPRSLRARRVRVAGTPTDVADVGSLAAVVTGAPHSAVTMIDAQFGGISAVVKLSARASAVRAAVFGRDVWVVNPARHALQRLDPPYTAVAATIPLAGTPTDVAAGEGAVWVAGGHTLWQVAPAGGRVLARRTLSFTPQAVAAGGGGVWLVDRYAGLLVRLDPRTGHVVARIRVGRGPQSVAAGLGSIWVASAVARTVSRIDATRNRVVATIHVGSAPIDVAVGLGSVWVVKRPA